MALDLSSASSLTKGFDQVAKRSDHTWARGVSLTVPFFYLREEQESAMQLRITSKRQVKIPAHVLDAMGVGPGDQIELIETPGGYLLRPRRIDCSRLGTLRGKIPDGMPPFDIRTFRAKPYDPDLRN